MFIPNVSWQCHEEYRTNVKNMMKKLSHNAKYQTREYEEEKLKLLSLNLDPVGRYVSGFNLIISFNELIHAMSFSVITKLPPFV